MPRVKLSARATEQSTYVATFAFTDAAGDEITPNTVAWSLTDLNGTAINSRTDVSATPGTTVKIVLSGVDLAFQAGETGIVGRLITIETTYDSTEGNDLPYREEYAFELCPLVKDVSVT